MEKVKCPFCRFDTTYPVYGKVYDCLGECYSTYTTFKDGEDQQRIKMRLVEIFYLDNEFNLRLLPSEIDDNCEFVTMPGASDGTTIMFARQKRVLEEDIEKLKTSSTTEIEIGVDTLDRLKAALDRFERDLQKEDIERKKLINDIRVVEAIVKIIREKLELSS